MRSVRCLVVCALSTVHLFGCAKDLKVPRFDGVHPGEPPVIPMAPSERVSIDARPLAELQNRIPDAPKPPLAPTARHRSIEDYLDRQKSIAWTGTEGIGLGRDESKGNSGRVAVLVEESEPRKFLADMMLLELQKRGAGLVERQYEGRVYKEQRAVVSAQTWTEGKEEDESLRRGREAADYLVVLHVGVDNQASARPTAEVLPLEIPDEHWAHYQVQAKVYLEAYGRYSRAINAYNAEMERLQAVWQDDPEQNRKLCLWSEYLEKFRAYDRRCREFNAGVRSFNAAVDRYETEYRDFSRKHDEKYKNWDSAKQGPKPAKEPKEEHTRLDETKCATAVKGLVYVCPDADVAPAAAPLDTPCAFPSDQSCPDIEFQKRDIPPPDALFDSKEAALGEHDPVTVTLTRFRTSVSCRVFDTRKGKASWFGLAEAQDVDYLEALRRVCERIASQLVTGREPETRAVP